MLRVRSNGLGECLGVFNEIIPWIATGFGAGMGRRSEVCSALAGGIMGLGLRFGRDFADNRDDGRRPYWYSTDFIENFRARHGRVCCRDLLGLDLFCTGGYPEVPGGGAVGIHCKDLIAAVA